MFLVFTESDSSKSDLAGDPFLAYGFWQSYRTAGIYSLRLSYLSGTYPAALSMIVSVYLFLSIQNPIVVESGKTRARSSNRRIECGA
jgi:hypothetical protein